MMNSDLQASTTRRDSTSLAHAMVMLHVNKNEFDTIVKKLLENEFLQYTSHNIIELTEIGISYLVKKEDNKIAELKPVEDQID